MRLPAEFMLAKKLFDGVIPIIPFEFNAFFSSKRTLKVFEIIRFFGKNLNILLITF